MKPQAIQMLIPEGSPTIDCATMTYTTVAYTLEINEDSYNTETDEKGIVVDYFIESDLSEEWVKWMLHPSPPKGLAAFHYLLFLFGLFRSLLFTIRKHGKAQIE